MDEDDTLFEDDVDETPAEQEDQTGEKETPEPPEGESKEGDEPKPEKLIPESRFKAALKDATDKLEASNGQLEAANAELAKLRQVPVPDKTEDPEGYDLHIRMEASKAAMRSTHKDYDEVIKHYAELAKVNPYLNEAVARHPVPAQYAYQIAQEDLRMKKLGEMEESEDYKEFLEWKKTKPEGESVDEKLTSGAKKVPNLNRATNVADASGKSEDDDELFAGAL